MKTESFVVSENGLPATGKSPALGLSLALLWKHAEKLDKPLLTKGKA
jgi:hypothetical protein